MWLEVKFLGEIGQENSVKRGGFILGRVAGVVGEIFGRENLERSDWRLAIWEGGVEKQKATE